RIAMPRRIRLLGWYPNIVANDLRRLLLVLRQRRQVTSGDVAHTRERERLLPFAMMRARCERAGARKAMPVRQQLELDRALLSRRQGARLRGRRCLFI